MLKRTKGRFLLTLLVITGLAGTLKNATLTKPERKLAVNDLKETKDEFLQSVKGLTRAQLNFKPVEGRRSIKEYIYHLTLAEKHLWKMLESAMKDPVAEHRNIKLSGEDLINTILNQPGRRDIPQLRQTSKAPWQSTAEAIAAFKALRADHIKYIRSTTEDLRNHFIQLPAGEADAYQFILFIAAHCAWYTAQINEIKTSPGFPR